MAAFYAALFVIPSIITFAWCGGRTQLSREELLASPAGQAWLRKRGQEGLGDYDLEKERMAAINKVLFETKGTLGKQEVPAPRAAAAAPLPSFSPAPPRACPTRDGPAARAVGRQTRRGAGATRRRGGRRQEVSADALVHESVCVWDM